jgi:hypothetical protein
MQKGTVLGRPGVKAIRLRLRFFCALLAGVLVVGALGFMAAEGLSLTDAIYFTIVTIATVGYGDVTPKSAFGKGLAIVLIVLGVGTFLGVIGNAIELMLARREEEARFEKLNMVIGVFFSEVGTHLLALFSDADADLGAIRNRFLVDNEWHEEDFLKVGAELKRRDCDVELERVDLDDLCAFLTGKRGFLVRLLENPVLLEHESFTNLLWAVFHLTEELGYRADKSNLPDADRAHLAGDINRAYGLLVSEWLDYMKHLKQKYPYLFSLALRMNPFDRDASPIVR